MFFCFTPIAFALLGAEAAARIGLAMQAQFAVNMLAMAWLYNVQPAMTKLGRGLSNFLLGWLEVPLNTRRYYTRKDTVGSSLAGAAVGAFKGAVRTGVGLYETVTFFLPYPEHFRPVLPTLEYFQKTSRRQPLPLE